MDGYENFLGVESLVTPEETAISSKQYLEDGMPADEIEEFFRDRDSFMKTYSTEWEAIPHPNGDLVVVSAFGPENELW